MIIIAMQKFLFANFNKCKNIKFHTHKTIKIRAFIIFTYKSSIYIIISTKLTTTFVNTVTSVILIILSILNCIFFN
jgi:hypothetical protein